ncbi:MAG TPA: phosphatase PAP2 family protein, partial [Chloroflexota bacterium]|nr:phosphatase PAP2 family protein [Chloroflexota bacterium]
MQGSPGGTGRQVSERALGRRSLGTVAGGGLALAGGVALAGGSEVVARAQSQGSAQIEPQAGTWSTWVLSAGNQLRLPAPPGAGETSAELARLEATMAGRDQAGLERVTYWNAGAPGYRWMQLAVKHTQRRGAVGNRAFRMLALLGVAIDDATVAAWDSKYAHNRPRPGTARPALATALPVPASPSYPEERAVAAGAAAALLGYVFPADAADFQTLAGEAAESRVLAGVAYPSDVAAGLELGRQVGALVVEWARQDGSDAVWQGSVPTGPGRWSGSNPVEPLAGTWKTWVLQAPDQLRPGPRAAYDSPELLAELAQVRDYPRTNLSNLTANYWEYYGGRAAFEYWDNQLGRKLFEEGLDANPPRAGRAYALLTTAIHDAAVACWDAKYHYWDARPAMLEPRITPLFTTPNHPSYPSAHGSIGSAACGVLGA